MSGTILMIHGMWAGGWVWENYRAFFEQKEYLCVAPTLKYHDMDPDGAPNLRLGTTSLLDYVADLERLIKKLETPPILIGHSMGGLIAQILAGRGLAEAVVLLTPASPYGILALRPSVIRSFWSTLTTWKFWEKPIRPTYAEASFAMLSLMPHSRKRRIYSKMVYESGRAGSEIGFWYFDPQKATNVEAAAITCPMLIMAGAKDRLTPVSVIRKIAKKYKAIATYKEFKDHAHWIMDEPGWQAVAQEASLWLDKVMAFKRLPVMPYAEQRHHKRIAFNAPITISDAVSNRRFTGNTDNYSLGGVQFTSQVALQEGAGIDVRLLDCVPGFDGPKANDEYKAEVIWCKEKAEASFFEIGVRFF